MDLGPIVSGAVQIQNRGSQAVDLAVKVQNRKSHGYERRPGSKETKARH